MIRLLYFVCGVVMLCFLTMNAAAMPIFYIGVGNSTPHDPQGEAAEKLNLTLKDAAKKLNQDYIPVTLKPKEGKEVGAIEITDAIAKVAAKAGPGDLFVFYYEGHGGQADNTPGKEDKQDDSDRAINKGDEYIGAVGNLLSDDELATSLNKINDKTHKLVIVDACYSGGMVKGADDIDRSTMSNLVYLLSVPEDQRDQGLWEFPNWLEEALKLDSKNKYPGDSNGDGKVTIGEWVDYAYSKRIAQHAGGSKGSTGWINSNPKDYIIAYVTEPETMLLLAFALVGLACVRRKFNH